MEKRYPGNQCVAPGRLRSGRLLGSAAPFQNFEAHDALIDWGMSTGLIGIVLHLVLWGWCLWRALRCRSPAFLGMMVATIVAVMFGYLLRHPFTGSFWCLSSP